MEIIVYFVSLFTICFKSLIFNELCVNNIVSQPNSLKINDLKNI